MLCVTIDSWNVQSQPRASSIVGFELHRHAFSGQLELSIVKNASEIRSEPCGESDSPGAVAWILTAIRA